MKDLQQRKKNTFRAGEINGWERLQKINAYTVITVVVESSMGIFQYYEQGNASGLNTKEWEDLVLNQKTKRRKIYAEPSKSPWPAWQPLQNKSLCFKPYSAKNFMSVLSIVSAMIDSVQSMVWMWCTEYASLAGLRPKSGIWCTNIPNWFLTKCFSRWSFNVSLDYREIWATGNCTAQRQFIHGHKDPRNHWEDMRMQYSPSALLPSPDIQQE